MNYLIKALFVTAAAASVMATYADDTEIFTGLDSSGGGADILFIVDTSGSMATLEYQEGEEYNPEIVYPGHNYMFASDGYYLFHSSAFWSDPGELSSDEITKLKQYQVDISKYNCSQNDTLNSISDYGYSTGRYAYYNPGEGWSGPDDDSGRSNSLWGRYAPQISTSSGNIIQCQESGRRRDYKYTYNGNDYRDLINSDRYDGFPYTRDRYQYLQYDWDENDKDEGYYNVIYSGNYLNYLRDSELGGTPKEQYKMRMDIVIDAAKEVISTNDEPNKRISLMRFSSDSEGGYVDIPMAPVNEIGDDVYDKIYSYHPAGGTPIAETLYEAHQYLTEGNVTYGSDAQYRLVPGYYRADDSDIGIWGNVNWSWYPGRYNQTFSKDDYPGPYVDTSNYSSQPASSDSEAVSGSDYTYPDAGVCGAPNQKVILFSDGQPTNDTDADTYITDLANSVDPGKYAYDTPNPGCKTYGTGNNQITTCLPALAWYMHHPDRRADDNLPELTIDTMGGFLGADSTAEPVLKELAVYGGGAYYPVSTKAEIVAAMAESFREVKDSPSTFTAPAIAVSSYNSLQISDELYYAVFEPNETGAWAGNLKRYRIGTDGVVDSNNDPAIGTDGFFLTSAVSFWSDTKDGPDVLKGGVAEQFADVQRNIKLIDSNGNLVQATPDTVRALTDDVLGLDEAGLSGEPYKDSGTFDEALANWVSGLTTDGSDNRKEMEDAIHSRPIVVNYSNSRQVVYIGTNSGYLHAFDTATGKEVFSILPREVLTNARHYMSPEERSSTDKIYGLDGPITYWHNDINRNGIVDKSEGETVYLYVGMRRGGHSYYAFNITDPANPSVLWQKHGSYINSDKNIPNVSDGYERLGQTWSSLKPAIVNWGGNNKVVLLAGGGYDPAEDDSLSTRIDHSTGNTIFMIDAVNGTVLWDAYNDTPGASSQMKNSFASDVTPVDRDGNGSVDLMFAADTGGRVWRFDWNDANSGFDGGVIADINTSATSGVSGNRRFFVSPDASFIETSAITETDSGAKIVKPEKFLLVALGSGYRAHPLDEEVNDHFYLIKDPHALDYPTSYKQLGLSDLANWSSSDATNSEKSVYGWYVDPAGVGEKIMSPSVTLNGILTFNTFAPSSDLEAASCSGNLGSSLTYQLALSEEIRNRVKCEDGSDSCKPETPGQSVQGGDPVPRLKPDPAVVLTPPPPCPEGQTCEPPTCEDYAIQILSGTTLTKGNMDRCDLFEANYWEEVQ